MSKQVRAGPLIKCFWKQVIQFNHVCPDLRSRGDKHKWPALYAIYRYKNGKHTKYVWNEDKQDFEPEA